VTVLHCGHLIDTLAGTLLGATSVVLTGEHVTELLPGAVSRAGATVIDLSEETCMPGLADMHVHLSGQSDLKNSFAEEMTLNQADWVVRSTIYARRTLMGGFTMVRDLGDRNYEVLALRNQINAGWVPGPRIFAAGPALGSTGGHADATDGLERGLQPEEGAMQSIVDSVDSARKAVRLHYKQNVDCIKIVASGGVQDESKSVDNPQLTEEEIHAIVVTAHDYGYTVAAHAHGPEAMRRAVVGGVDSIEHGTFMSEQVMQLMKEHGTYYVPTMYTATFVTEKAKIPGAYSAAVTRKALLVGPQILKTVAAAYQHGVTLAYGTDEGVFPHGENWRDFPLLVQAGVPAMYAVQMATINAAKLIKHDDELGSVTVGKEADVVAVKGNPLENVQLMGKIDFVMRAGVIYKQDGKEIAPDRAPR
jgi:imidazolonepropionase-like amidohydrolase